MSQKPPILNCNNSNDCNIYHTAKVNAAATAAIKTPIGVAAKDDIADTKRA
jgi:hypothetical protein